MVNYGKEFKLTGCTMDTRCATSAKRRLKQSKKIEIIIKRCCRFCLKLYLITQFDWNAADILFSMLLLLVVSGKWWVVRERHAFKLNRINFQWLVIYNQVVWHFVDDVYSVQCTRTNEIETKTATIKYRTSPNRMQHENEKKSTKEKTHFKNRKYVVSVWFWKPFQLAHHIWHNAVVGCAVCEALWSVKL